MGVKVIAHRGSNKKAPQNTLPAFRQAIAEGTDGFETDVHLTKDKKLVICHNYTIDDTSNGVGNITSYTLGELKKFDFGSYFGNDFANTPLPTLDEFLDLVKDTDAEIINIELKSQKDRSTEIVRRVQNGVSLPHKRPVRVPFRGSAVLHRKGNKSRYPPPRVHIRKSVLREART